MGKAEQDREKGARMHPTAGQLAVLTTKYGGRISPVEIGNRYLVGGAQYLPGVLGSVYQPNPAHSELSWARIASALPNQASAVAQSVPGAVDRVPGASRKVTEGKPGSACGSAAVTSVSGSM